MAIPQPVVRPAHYAGTWYPGDAQELRESIEAYLAGVSPETLPGRTLALVSPHAGHRFGGRVAAHAYALLKGQPIQRVVLIGPLHRPILGALFSDLLVPAESAYATPLGQVPVDRDFIDQLNKRVPLKSVRRDEEHSLEIELPFLQVVLQGFTLAPIMIGADIAGSGVPARLDALAAALAELADEHTLFVCSTDLSHLHNYDEVRKVDQHMQELVNAFNLDRLTEALVAGRVMACGATGLVTALRAAKLRGATGARVLAYMSSGDITGDTEPGNYTVGYMAAAAYG
ncbi:MAG TPA: AmmeMemoRadiSam system protein B [Anaerolineae bacterium]